jgi:hypothetical protein
MWWWLSNNGFPNTPRPKWKDRKKGFKKVGKKVGKKPSNKGSDEGGPSDIP